MLFDFYFSIFYFLYVWIIKKQKSKRFDKTKEAWFITNKEFFIRVGKLLFVRFVG